MPLAIRSKFQGAVILAVILIPQQLGNWVQAVDGLSQDSKIAILAQYIKLEQDPLFSGYENSALHRFRSLKSTDLDSVHLNSIQSLDAIELEAKLFFNLAAVLESVKFQSVFFDICIHLPSSVYIGNSFLFFLSSDIVFRWNY